MTTRILVVDDEKNILALFKKMLSVEAFRSMDNPYDSVEVETAISGEEAWAQIQSGSFDLIISDLAMEGMSGIELLERVKSFKPDVPFMILTGVGTIEDAVRSMKLGAYDYLTKPFQHDELLLSICKALDYGRLHTEVKTLRQKLNYTGQNGGTSKILSDEYVNGLLNRNWTGSIRELEKVVEKAVEMTQSEITDHNRTSEDVELFSGNDKRSSDKNTNSENAFAFSDEQRAVLDNYIRKNFSLKSISDSVVGVVEKIVILKVLGEVGDNKAEAARRLGISRPALYKKLKDHNIE